MMNMSTVALCRVCLASNTKMHHIANTPYQEIFEKLAMELCTEDGRPETVCWVCLSALRRGRRLADTARAAREILTQLSLSGIQLSEDTVSILDRKFVRKLAWTPIQTQSIDEGYEHSTIKKEIKQEPPENHTYFELCDETQALNQTQSEMINTQAEMNNTRAEMNNTQAEINNTQVVLRLTYTEMDRTQKTNTRCQTFNIKQEQLNDEEVSESMCSGNKFSEIQIGQNELTHVEQSIGKKEKTETEGMSVDDTRQQAADIKQETIEIPAEFEVAFTHRPEETPRSKSKKMKQSYETLVTQRDGQVRVKHACPRCENTYTHRCHLLRHIRMHADGTGQSSRNFCCETCGKAFHTKSILTKHQISHSDVKKYSCDHCPTKCSQKIDMERHMTIHTGEKPFQCDVCKQKFNRKSNMQLHILTHADKKPFTCQICHMTFSRKYDLNRHTKRKHICHKPYACDICDFRSGNASYMKTHMANMHLNIKGEKPFSCSVCSLKCASENSLKYHMKKKHFIFNKKVKISMQF